MSDSNSNGCRGDFRCGRGWCKVQRIVAGNGQQSVKINLVLDPVTDLDDLFISGAGLVTGDEAQVTLVYFQCLVAMHATDDRHIRVMLNHGAQLGLVPTAAQLIQDDAGDPDLGVKCLVAQYQWCNAAGHATGIEYQDDRCVRQCRQRGIAVARYSKKRGTKIRQLADDTRPIPIKIQV